MTDNRERAGICHACGLKHGTRTPGGAHTRWGGRCKWCGRFMTSQQGGVTDTRHYGYPEEPKDVPYVDL